MIDIVLKYVDIVMFNINLNYISPSFFGLLK